MFEDKDRKLTERIILNDKIIDKQIDLYKKYGK